VIHGKVSMHLLRYDSSQVSKSWSNLAHMQNIEPLIQVAEYSSKEFITFRKLKMVNEGRDILNGLNFFFLIFKSFILLLVRSQVIFLFEVNFKLPLVMLLHNLIIFNWLFLVNWLVFLNILDLLWLLDISIFLFLSTHHDVLFLNHLLILINLLLQ
jgi:hypothetical protein